MNKLLHIYHLSLDFPDVSGAEQLELLMIRDQIADLKIELNSEEQRFLSEADRKLITSSTKIYQELSHFIDLADYRKNHNILPQKWWWYLDVLVSLPSYSISAAA